MRISSFPIDPAEVKAGRQLGRPHVRIGNPSDRKDEKGELIMPVPFMLLADGEVGIWIEFEKPEDLKLVQDGLAKLKFEKAAPGDEGDDTLCMSFGSVSH